MPWLSGSRSARPGREALRPSEPHGPLSGSTAGGAVPCGAAGAVARSWDDSLPRHCTDVRGCVTFGKMTNPKPKAIALLSGGIDSTTALALAQRQGFDVYALTFRYGQRHEIEIAAARRVARALHVARHEIVEFDLRRFGGAALTAENAGPKDRTPAELAAGVPGTLLSARHTLLPSLSFGCGPGRGRWGNLARRS